MLNKDNLRTISENFPTVAILALVATVVFLFKQNANLYERIYHSERELRLFWQEAYILTDPTRFNPVRSRGDDDSTRDKHKKES